MLDMNVAPAYNHILQPRPNGICLFSVHNLPAVHSLFGCKVVGIMSHVVLLSTLGKNVNTPSSSGASWGIYTIPASQSGCTTSTLQKTYQMARINQDIRWIDGSPPYHGLYVLQWGSNGKQGQIRNSASRGDTGLNESKVRREDSLIYWCRCQDPLDLYFLI